MKNTTYFNGTSKEKTSAIIFESYPDLVTTKQMKEMLHIANSKAYSLLKNGDVKSIRIGNSHRIVKNSIIDYVMKSMEKSV